MENRIIIIDGNSLLNRAYYAMQKPMTTKEGLYTQGVYGFLNMLAKLQKDYAHGYIAVTFDRKAPTFRHLAYAEYKAGRKKTPPELAMQFPLLKEVLCAMRIAMVEADGFEADDLIGAIAKNAEQNGLDVLIVTGDKDELQLASDKTHVMIMRKGITEFELYDKETMLERYGFAPEQLIDFKGLMGDPSDNIPGLPGVGEKTATKLLLEFGSVENLIAQADQIPNEKMRHKIKENAAIALLSKKLATIDTNAPAPADLATYRRQAPDAEQLIDAFVKLEFNSMMKKLGLSALREQQGKQQGEQPFAGDVKAKNKAAARTPAVLIQTMQDFRRFEEAMPVGEAIILKIFSDGNRKDRPIIYGIAMLSAKGCHYIQTEDTELLGPVCRLLMEKRPRITGHHLIDDYYALLAGGFFEQVHPGGADGKEPGADGGLSEAVFDTAFDTAIAQYVLEPTKNNFELQEMLFAYFGEEIEQEKAFLSETGQIDLFSDVSEKQLAYAGKWCGAVSDLRNLLEQKLEAEALASVFYDIEVPLIEVLASMEADGFSIDRTVLERTGEELAKQIEALTQEIHALAGEPFNINSPQQLGHILFEKLGLPAGKKTKTGYSTNAEVLEKLKNKHPVIDRILRYRTIAKLKGTYIDGLLPLMHRDGKIHAHFQQTVTATGRISCTEPNLQNIPIRQEEGRKIRKAFVPSVGCCLLGADYSQIELRILAHMSEDAQLIEAFNRGDDIHALTASKVLNISEDEISIAQRSAAKAVNFGVIYGMGAFGLSTELNISRGEAEAYIREYFNQYADVKAFIDAQVENGRRNGVVTTIMNRKRAIPEIKSSNHVIRQLGERLAMNSPIQGSAADIIKIAMVRVYRRLRAEQLKTRLILQVHDELILDAAHEEADVAQELLTSCMESAVKLKVKLSVGISRGESWYDLK